MNKKIIFYCLISLAFVGCTVLGRHPTSTPLPPTPTPLPPTLTPTPTPEPTLQPGESTRTITVNSQERRYFIHIPSGLSSLQPVPVVFAFHGWTMNTGDMQVMTGFNPIADKNGFLIIYPWGTDNSWNGGGCCGTALEKNVDEIAFVRQMLSDLETIARIDPKRIYATGVSNGGQLSYRLACEMSDTFAAIAPVIGVLDFEPCQPQQPVSVMHVHGMNDTIIPYEGGKSDLEDLGMVPPGFKLPSVDQSIATWVQLDGCTGSPKQEKEGQVTHISYESCQAGTTVELYKIDGLGHDYPITMIFPTSQKIWEFFAAHPKP